MLKEREKVVRRAMMGLDILIVSSSFFISYFLRQHFHDFYKLTLFPSVRVIAEKTAPIESYIILLFFLIPIWFTMLYFSKIYSSMRTKTDIQIIWSVIKASVLTAISFSVVVFLFKFSFVSRAFFAIFMSVSTFFLLFEKLLIFHIARAVRKTGYNYRRLLIVGTGPRAENFIRTIKQHPEWGFKIQAVLACEKLIETKYVENIKVKGSLDDLKSILLGKTTDEVIFVVSKSELSNIEPALHVCETLGIKAAIEMGFFKSNIAKLSQSELEGIPFMSFDTTTTDELSLFFKKLMDITVALLAVFILSPLFLIVAVFIKLSSRGPVFFVQRRVGLNGRKFTLYKFRTMHKDAHRMRTELEKDNESDGPVFKIKKDPRVTRLGRFLRKYSIDELPQLFNVLKGNMSLVGPRPPLPREVAQYELWQRRRLSMRPGLTCLWQVNGRNNIAFSKWMEMDLEYIDTWSLSSDLRILIKTIPVVLMGDGR